MIAFLRKIFAPRARVPHQWANAVNAKLRLESLNEALEVTERPDGRGWEFDLYPELIGLADAEPFRVTVNENGTVDIAGGDLIQAYGSSMSHSSVPPSTGRTANTYIFLRYYVGASLCGFDTVASGPDTGETIHIESSYPGNGWTLARGLFVYTHLIAELDLSTTPPTMVANHTGHLHLHDRAGHTVATSEENKPSYLAEAFANTGTKGSSDLIVKRDALQGSVPGQQLRFYLPDPGALSGTPTKIMAQDASGNWGWIPIADVCGYCEDEWCPDLADEYTLALTLQVWHIPDDAKFMDGNPPTSPSTFTRVGNSCEWTLADIRERCFDKLTPAGAACITECDSGVTNTLKRNEAKTRWEVWEDANLFGYNDDASAPDAGTWQPNTAVDGYASSYSEGTATYCGWSTSTMHVEVLTIGVS
jgi:hypothetical protein